MSATIEAPLSPSRSANNPLEAARLRLIERFTALRMPGALSTFPIPYEYTAIADSLREAMSICDDMITAIGTHVADNASHHVDPRSFDGVCTGAADDAFYEIEQCAERLIEDRDELRSQRRRA